MGVITTALVREGETFGPIPSNLTITDPTLLIGHMTSDSRPDVHTVKINIHEYGRGARLAEWVPYVQAARDEREQNIEALVREGQLYYRVLRTVPAHRELLVWYSEDLATILGVPELNEVYYNDNGTYCCPYCAQNFRYANSLRAHLRFKCETVRKAMHMDTPGLRPPVSLMPPGFGMYRIATSTPAGNTNLSPSGSITSAASSRESASPPTYNHSPNRESEVSRKRSHSDSGSESPSGSRSPEPKRRSSSDETETRSAFRKVERHTSPLDNDQRSSTVSRSPPFSKVSEDRTHPNSSINTLNDISTSKPLTLPPNLVPLGGGARYPLGMSNPAFMSQLSAARLHNENLPLTRTDPAAKRLNEKFMDIHNMENNNVYKKMGIYPDRRMMSYPQLFKSNNPMVDKILHCRAASVPASLSSFSLAQNWCAKCNTTFRMTSDLVYHMRSHHKREFDPMKRKREEKLKCDVCGETFKERHHLSRHMTSHA